MENRIILEAFGIKSGTEEHIEPQDVFFKRNAVMIKIGSRLIRILADNPKRFCTEIHRMFPQVPPKITIGAGCNIHPTAFIALGSEGFGYYYDEDGIPYHRPHFGGVLIGNNVDIGAHSCIDRGMFSDTMIGDGCKIDNLVHIAHNCLIGDNAMIVAGAVICGSVVIGENCWIGAGARIIQKVTIGDGAVIGMGAVVLNNIGPGETWVGNPARKIDSKRGSRL